MNLKSKLTFGKYKGRSIQAICRTDPMYLVWCMENTSNLKLSVEDRIKIYKKAEYIRPIVFNWDFHESR